MEVGYVFFLWFNFLLMFGVFEFQNGIVEWIEIFFFNYELMYMLNDGFIGIDEFCIVCWDMNFVFYFIYFDVIVIVVFVLIKVYYDYVVIYFGQFVMVDVLVNDISSNGVKVL